MLKQKVLKKGREEEKLAIVKSMLAKGLGINLIKELKGLTSKTIESLV